MFGLSATIFLTAWGGANAQGNGFFGPSAVGFEDEPRHLVDPVGLGRDESGNSVSRSGNAFASGNSSACGNRATAIGNLVSVQIQGSNNTVIVNANQVSSGSQSALITLNGSLDFSC